MIKVSDFKVEDNLKTPEDVVDFLNAALEESPKTFMHALGTAAKSEGMSSIARELRVSRSSLYKSLSEAGNPSFSVVWDVLRLLGVQISLKTAKVEERVLAD